MTSLPALAIDAVVHPFERPVLAAAARQLADTLSTASGSPHLITLRFSDSLASISRSSERAVVVASLLLEIPGRDEPLSQTEARWRESLEKLGTASAFVCTIFRHVGSREAPAPIERIRRLNLLAVRLSHDTGVGVIDIDRIFGFFGARQLQTDYRLSRRLGVELAGHTIVAGILATGLDDVIPLDIQDRAQKVQAGMLDRLSGEVAW